MGNVEASTTDAAELDRYVYIRRARCPICESPELKTQKTVDNGDDSLTRETKCRECGHRFFVVVE